MIKPVYEFILWDNCRNNCLFCHLKKNKQLSVGEKQKSLNSVIEFIESDNFEKGSHILLIGGEIFDSPPINNNLNLFFNNIINKMCDNTIDLLYLNTNLLYKNTDSLYYFLNLIVQNKLSERLKFTTSFDIKGRYSSNKMYELYRRNLESIKQKFPSINIIANVILTKALCEFIKTLIQKHNYSITDIENQYVGCKIMFIPYIVFDKDLTPTKDELLRTLITLKQIGYNINQFIMNMDIQQERRLYKFDGNKFNYCSANILECGHSENFKKWSQNDECFVCMVKELFDVQ